MVKLRMFFLMYYQILMKDIKKNICKLVRGIDHLVDKALTSMLVN